MEKNNKNFKKWMFIIENCVCCRMVSFSFHFLYFLLYFFGYCRFINFAIHFTKDPTGM